jgi:hypothetical protein
MGSGITLFFVPASWQPWGNGCAFFLPDKKNEGGGVLGINGDCSGVEGDDVTLDTGVVSVGVEHGFGWLIGDTSNTAAWSGKGVWQGTAVVCCSRAAFSRSSGPIMAANEFIKPPTKASPMSAMRKMPLLI